MSSMSLWDAFARHTCHSKLSSEVSMPALQVKGIPFVVFDVGGVMEMINIKAHSDVVIRMPTLDALAARLSSERCLDLSNTDRW